VIGVNIRGVIHGIRHLALAILRHGEEGHIVNIATVIQSVVLLPPLTSLLRV
jgi:NAD(P)-dependent dehydrogenase (short-subunit alcohol dehydrogenase family)